MGGAAATPTDRERRPLSAREREILGLLAKGLSGAAIAEQLFLSPETVRTHVRNAMTKLGASTRSQAVAMALGDGIIPSPEGEEEAPAASEKPASARRRRDALAELAAGLTELADIDWAAVYLVDETGMTLRLTAHAGAASVKDALPDDTILGDGAIGRMALRKRAHLVANPSIPGLPHGPILGVPLVRDGRCAGVLCLAVRPSRPVTRREMLLFDAFAGRVAEVIGAPEDPGPQLRLARRLFTTSWIRAVGH